MNYKDINDKWKSFLFENTFKEDKLIDPDKVKKKKKRKPEKKDKEDGKQIITNEFEEFGESDDQLEEMSSMSGGAVEGHAGGEEGPWISKEEFKDRWGLTEKKK